MALTTYADLLTKIAEYHDDSTTVISSIVADMVTLAEGRIFNGYGGMGDTYYSKPLRCPALETSTVVPISSGQSGGTSSGSSNAQTVTVSGTPTLSNGFCITFVAGFSNTGPMTLDANALGVVNVKKGRNRLDLQSGDIIQGGYYTVYYDGTQFVLIPSDGAAPLPVGFMGMKNAYLQNRGREIFPIADSAINSLMANSVACEPLYYAVERGCIRVAPMPNMTYNLALSFYKKPTALSTALNDVFADAPSIYLYATLLELSLYMPDEHADKWFSQYNAACNGYMASSSRSQIGHQPMRLRLPIAP